MTVGVLGHPVERRYQLTPPSSRFYLVHLSGEFLLDALAKADVVRAESHISQKVNALAQGKHTVVPLHPETDTLNMPMDGITNLPQFRFRFTQYDAVITIAVEMTHGIPVLQIMVQKHRQKQITQALRATQADTQPVRHQPDKIVKHGDEFLVLEHPVHAIHHEILLHAFVKFGDIELVTVPRPFRVLTHVTADIRQKVVHPPFLDTGRGGTDETFPQMAVHHRHDGVYGNTVIHRDDLDTAQLAALENLALTVVLHTESTVRDTRGQFLQHLGFMRKQVASLAAAFTPSAAKDLTERLRHIGGLHNLLNYKTCSVHTSFVFHFGAFNPPGPASSNRFRPTKPYPTLYFSVFQPKKAAVTEACFPRHHNGDKSPVLYAD